MQDKPTAQQAIQRAVRLSNGQAGLARRVDVSPTMVHKWLNGAQVSAERAVAIERATAGAVRRHELRPDLFDAPAGSPVTTEEAAT